MLPNTYVNFLVLTTISNCSMHGYESLKIENNFVSDGTYLV